MLREITYKNLTSHIADEWKKILDWLYKSDKDSGTSKHETLREAIARGKKQSGEWLLQTDAYVEWKRYPQGLLWLFGNCRSR